jgi:hypothetical protein
MFNSVITPNRSSTELEIDSIADFVSSIRETNTRRLKNNRDTLLQSLLAGQSLLEIKNRIPHGSWLAWVEENYENMGYSRISSNPIRAVQLDMQLFNSWYPYMTQLRESGIPVEMDELVDKLTDNQLDVTLSAMQEFMRKDTPSIAFEMALKQIREKSSLSIHDAKGIVAASKVISELPEDARIIARDLFQTHGVSNPLVLSRVPELMNNKEVLEEIQTTGHISVPTADDVRVVDIAHAGISDIDIVLGAESLEKELRRQNHIRESLIERKRISLEFDFQHRYEGSLPDVIQFLNNNLQNDGTIYSVTVYKKI